MFESVDARTDARTPARVPSYKLTLWAFGSGELKSIILLYLGDLMDVHANCPSPTPFY